MDRDRVGGRRRGAAVDRPGRRSVEDVIGTTEKAYAGSMTGDYLKAVAAALNAMRRLAGKAVPA